MKVIYDRDTDSLTVIFAETPVVESDETNLALFWITMPMGISFRLKSWMHRGGSTYQVKSSTRSLL